MCTEGLAKCVIGFYDGTYCICWGCEKFDGEWEFQYIISELGRGIDLYYVISRKLIENYDTAAFATMGCQRICISMNRYGGRSWYKLYIYIYKYSV